MITKAYFEQLKEDTRSGRVTRDCNPIAQPQEYPDDNYHAQTWCNQYLPATDSQPERIRVSLEEFSTERNIPSQPSDARRLSAGVTIPLALIFLAIIFG